MPTESTFILASIFIILAATGWALGYFGERDDQPPLNIDYRCMGPGNDYKITKTNARKI